MIISDEFQEIDEKGRKRIYLKVKCDKCLDERKMLKFSAIKLDEHRCRKCKKYTHKYGESTRGSRLYNIWNAIKERCENENHASYKDYGARGISLAGYWRNDYMSFRDYCISIGYEENLVIDKIDNDIGYEIGNIRFVNRNMSNANRRKMNRTDTKYGKSSTVFGISCTDGKYRGAVRFNNIQYHTKRFNTEEEAIMARNELIDTYSLPNNKSNLQCDKRKT